MPDPVTAIGGGSIVSGLMGADAASDAADAQAGAAASGIAEQRRQFDFIQNLLKPYVDAGGRGLGAYENLLGLSGDGGASAINQIKTGPQYTALTNAAEEAILQNASATGGLRGGNVQQALAGNRQRILAGLIGEQLGRFGQLATVGQNSAAGVGNAALGMGNNVSQLLQQQGAAESGGIIAGSNAITRALSGVGGLAAGSGIGGYGGGGSVVAPGYSVGDATAIPTGDFARMDRAF